MNDINDLWVWLIYLVEDDVYFLNTNFALFYGQFVHPTSLRERYKRSVGVSDISLVGDDV